MDGLIVRVKVSGIRSEMGVEMNKEVRVKLEIRRVVQELIRARQ